MAAIGYDKQKTELKLLVVLRTAIHQVVSLPRLPPLAFGATGPISQDWCAVLISLAHFGYC